MASKFYPLEEFGNKIQQAVMPVVAMADGEIIPLGTGFVIAADGLMMTAKHVLDEFAVTPAKRRDGHGYYKNVGLYALYITDRKHGKDSQQFFGGLWPIQKIWFSAELDIAYCWLQRATENGQPIRFAVMGLSPAPPMPGEHICGFGYYSSNASRRQGEFIVDYSHNTAFTEGTVTEVFPLRRDQSFLKFPCFQSTARFEPGMSGGPVVNKKGYVCGVICSSYSGMTDETGYVSFVSAIWPALGTSIEVALDEAAPARMMLVHDLVQKGLILADDTIQSIAVVTHEDNSRTVSLKISKAETRDPKSSRANTRNS